MTQLPEYPYSESPGPRGLWHPEAFPSLLLAADRLFVFTPVRRFQRCTINSMHRYGPPERPLGYSPEAPHWHHNRDVIKSACTPAAALPEGKHHHRCRTKSTLNSSKDAGTRKTELTMNAILLCLFAFAVSSFQVASAQPPGGKPVLTATPPAAAPPPAQPVTGPHVAPDNAAPVDVDPNYIVGPDDSIQVNVWKEPTFSGAVLVRPDGMITLPALGDIPAAGRTPMQLAADITTLLKKFIIDPLVTVTVNGVNSKHVYLVGEIGHIGPLAMTPEMTVLQAIASAGGLSPYANAKHIYILRGEPGKQAKIPFNYKKAVKSGDMQGITLQPGDTIVVP